MIGCYFCGYAKWSEADRYYAVRAKRLLLKGCQGYLVYAVLRDVTPSSVENVKVVRHFPNVIP